MLLHNDLLGCNYYDIHLVTNAFQYNRIIEEPKTNELRTSEVYRRSAGNLCLQPFRYPNLMDDIRYSRIRVIYVLRPCVVGFALRNVRYIFRRKMALVMFNIFVACHNFKMTVRNYSVVRLILLITMFV